MDPSRQERGAFASADGPPPSRGSGGQGSAFVGRDAELETLVVGLEEAPSGRGHLFLLSGEPGIGKSRLAEVLAEQAIRRGARVLWGRCWEAGGAPAYWPWVQVIRSYVRDVDPETLRPQMGAGASQVAQMLPELRDMFPDLPPPPQADPDTARFRLFDATATFLRNAALARPLVVVLDDLHVADTPSLLLLQFLAAEIAQAPILLIVAYRDTELTRDHPLTTTVADLVRRRSTRRVPLAGLSPEDVGRFIELTIGRPPPPDLVTAVHAETEGNPLFVEEVVRHLAAEGALEEEASAGSVTLSVPQGVREVIARRLSRFSNDCNLVLSLASVLGREFDLDALARVSGTAAQPLLEVLDEAVADRLVVDVPGTLGRLRFSHALVRDTLYEDLPAPRRVRLHLEIGETLEALYGAGSELHLAELAHHFVQAAPGGNVDKAVDYARRAGETAVRLLAYEEAIRLFEMGLQALGLKGTVDEESHCELLLNLGDAQTRAGDFATAKETFRLAADIAEREGMPDRLARAALGYGGRFIWEGGRDDPQVAAILERALAAMGDRKSELRVKVLARLAAGPLRDHPDRSRADALSSEAVDMARRIGDPSTLAYALACRCVAVWGPDNLDERLAVADELVDVARQVGDLEREHQGRVWRCFSRWEVGDIAGVYEDVEGQLRVEAELGQPAQIWLGTTTRAVLATFEGRFEEAERLISKAAEVGRRAAGPMVPVYRIELLWALRREQDRLEEVAGDIKRVARRFPMYLVLRSELADAYAGLGREHEARGEYESLAADGFVSFPRHDYWLFGLCLLAEVADRLGDTRGAGALYDLLLPYGERLATFPTEACGGSVSRALGILAALIGRWDEAERHFEDAVELNARTGGRPWVAHTQYDHARMFLARDREGDRERAGTLLAGALETCRELGMATLEKRITTLIEEPLVAGEGPARPARPSVFRREGEFWSVSYEGDLFRLKDLKGLRYIARLLGEPGREFYVIDLAAAEAGGRGEGLPADPGLRAAGLGDAGEVLDPQAKRAYRRRLAELEEEIEEARGFGDAERATRAEEERDFLVRELAGALGLGGRDRKAGSTSERARAAVTRAIRDALARIRKHSRALGDHLDRTIRTGTFCSYQPDPRAPVDWQL